MKRTSIWKWLLQTFLPVGLFVAYSSTQTEPFSSEHAIAKFVILVGLYTIWHIYVNLVREDRL